MPVHLRCLRARPRERASVRRRLASGDVISRSALRLADARVASIARVHLHCMKSEENG